MKEKQIQHLDDLAVELVTGREFPARTPHTYAHAGERVLRRFHLLPDHQMGEPLGSNVRSLFPDIPQAAIYYFPGEAGI